MSRWISDDPLPRGAIGIVGLMSRHERDDLAVPRAADANPLLPTRIVRRRRICVNHVQLIVLVDVQPTRTAELFPLGKELSVGIEDLQTRVGAVADEHASARVECERMRVSEFAGARSELAALLDEF